MGCYKDMHQTRLAGSLARGECSVLFLLLPSILTCFLWSVKRAPDMLLCVVPLK